MNKYILSLLLGFVGFIGFGNATDVDDLIQKVCLDSSSSDCEELVSVVDLTTSRTTIVDFGSNRYQGKTICIRLYDFSFTSPVSDVFLGWLSNINVPYSPIQYSNNYVSENYVCMASNRYLIAKVNAGASPISFKIEAFVLNDLLSTALPIMTSMECQTEYGLMPVSSCDVNYCISNDLCPVFTGNNFSELIINDIVHESAPLINITIPQEYSRDYSVNENEFTLDISGYNVDYEYIDGIIKTQNSKPTIEDFNKIISDLLPLFVPGLVIILFLVFVFRFVKKVF